MIVIITKGGAGSGFHGHAGIPGHQGGSQAGGGSLDMPAPKEEDFGTNYTRRWLESRFDVNPPINDMSQYVDNTYNDIRDSYVVNDERTLRYNSALRAGNPPTKWALNIDKLMRSTLKEDGTLYRGAVLSEDVIQGILDAEGFTDKGFMSTTGDADLSLAYLNIRKRDAPAGKIACMFHLHAPAGTKIGIMDASEFVLPRNTKIGITDYHVDENGIYHISGEIQ